MLNHFENYLQNSFQDCNDGKVKEAALYSLMSGGKRVRPQLLFAALASYRIPYEKGFAVASAIEMIHTYSLIHDDLPAMDNDTLRRGKPCCHIQYGEAIAILAGDALLTHSFAMIASATIDSVINAKLVKVLSESSGLKGMIYGQELDVLNEHNLSCTLQDLETIHHYKTGNLISLPLICAAIIAKKDDDLAIWQEIGFIIGLLFQIQDDVLDVEKTSFQLGKDANSDHGNGKVTYVTLLGVEKCNLLIEELYEKAISLLDSLIIDKQYIIKMFETLLKREY